MKLIIELTESEIAKLEEITKSSFGAEIDAEVSDAISKLLESQPHFTDLEKRIFLSAMSREMKICKEVCKDDDYVEYLPNVVASIESKVKKSELWREGDEG